jgi:DNA mismatch endonuclease (patch repair protein)
MSQIRSKNTQLEKKLEEILEKTHLSYRKHYEISGKPDFAFPDMKIAIFADSHFWHGHRWNETKGEIKTNRDFWIKKIERNIKRDQEVNEILQKLGWQVIRFWENEITNDPEGCLNEIMDAIKNRQESG